MKMKMCMRTMAVAGIAAAMLCTGIPYVFAEESVSTVSESGAAEEKEEKSAMDAVSRMEDLTICAGAKDFDFLNGILYDGSLVSGIDVDTSKADLQSAGVYDVTYQITSNPAAMNAYLTGTDIPKESPDEDPEELTETRKVTVLPEEDAKKAAEDRQLVYGADGNVMPGKDGNVPIRKRTAPVSMDGREEAPIDAAIGKAALTEKDLNDVITGIEDCYVLVGAKDVEYAYNILYDGDIVEGVAVDSRAVDTSTPGTYELLYQVTVNRDALDAYTSSIVKAEKSGGDEDQEKPQDYKAAEQADIEDGHKEPVVFVRSAVVVPEEEAVRLADENVIVFAGGTGAGSIVLKTDGTIPGTKDAASIPASLVAKDVPPVSAATGVPADTASTPKSNSTENTGNVYKAVLISDQPQAAEPVPQQPSAPDPAPVQQAASDPAPAQPVHEHSWVPQTSTVNHPAETKVVHHDAQYNTVHHDAQYQTVHHDAQYQTVHHDAVTHEEPVYEWHEQCSVCGAMDPSLDHMITCDSSCIGVQIQSGATTVVDSPAWDEQVQVSAAWDEQVLVSDAWDEQVLVSDAWDETVVVKDAWTETVTTGYVCSGCGATK